MSIMSSTHHINSLNSQQLNSNPKAQYIYLCYIKSREKIVKDNLVLLGRAFYIAKHQKFNFNEGNNSNSLLHFDDNTLTNKSLLKNVLLRL